MSHGAILEPNLYTAWCGGSCVLPREAFSPKLMVYPCIMDCGRRNWWVINSLALAMSHTAEIRVSTPFGKQDTKLKQSPYLPVSMVIRGGHQLPEI